MEITKQIKNPNPREKANSLSLLFYGYTYGMFKKGFRKTLEVDDLYNPLTADRSKILGDKLQKNWEKQQQKSKKSNSKPSLIKALIKTFWIEYTKLGAMVVIIDSMLKTVQPLLLAGLLDYFKPKSQITKDEAFFYASAIFVTNATYVFVSMNYTLEVYRSGMRSRTACCSLIYRKALKLSKTALGDTASGKIVNLLSNDVSRFDTASYYLHKLWVAPATSLIALWLLYKEARFAGLVGAFAVFVIAQFQSYTGKLSAKYRKKTAIRTDERIRLMDEIISGIQVIKMYVWEKPFRKTIHLARQAELLIVTKSSYVRAMYMAFNLLTIRTAVFFTVLTLVLTEEPITASRVFVVMSYLDVLSFSMLTMFTRGVSELSELLVAIKRIQDFLLNEEFDSTKTNSYMNGNIKNIDDFGVGIFLKNLTVKWNRSYKEIALESINLSIFDGQLIGVIGPVGSGKSSLLQTVLGELDIVKGDMRVNGRISYASQEPWVFAANIRQNILFGEEYDKKRYEEVIQVCALKSDFDQFEDGDLTIVGDRGASLSGGQKARINLARAVYREADVYLLDDPLSAVDIHVSKHLYEKCINGYLAKKTRVLVTHQVHYLQDVDHLIILNNGRIEDEGTFSSLANSENEYAKLLTAEPENTESVQNKINTIRFSRTVSSKGDIKDEDTLNTFPDGENEYSKLLTVEPDNTSPDFKYSSKLSERSLKESTMGIGVKLSLADPLLSNDSYVEEQDAKEKIFQMKDLQEESSKGKVQGSLLLHYMQAGSNFFATFIIVVLFLGAQALISGVDYWVSYWVTIEELRNKSDFGNSTGPASTLCFIELTTYNCLYIFTFLLVTLFAVVMIRSFYFYNLAMMSSSKLHSVMFDNVIGATMRFFDTNPGGRILNKFSKDMGSIDEALPKVIFDSGQILLTMLGSLLLVIIVNPYLLILSVFMCVAFGFMTHVYLKSSRDIKRLEGIMRSPAFTHLKATIEGLTTVRAFKAQNVLMDEFDRHQDYHSSAWYMFLMATAAFGFYLSACCAVFLGVATFSFLLFGEVLNTKIGDVGLAITQSITLISFFQWGLRQAAEMANQLVSVERILEYNGLQKEIQPENPKILSKDWPSKGEIIFKDTSLRYFENGPLVLKNLNFTIKPKEKVGVVGRTGAGKSSLIQALFRLAPVEGSIKIDDIDTNGITLETLRLKISIIPQDPVLFSGTLKYNLDPFDEYTDEALYRAIEEVELKDPANIANRLENKVMDRGSNYSVGQRQLICLARAILKNNRVLLLDEATANVDPQTDSLIQETIRRKFIDCTVITVAHRLNTIMDSDKVIVMDSSKIAEFDHPHLLIQNKNGVFYNMVMETGRETSELLRKIASDSYHKYSALRE